MLMIYKKIKNIFSIIIFFIIINLFFNNIIKISKLKFIISYIELNNEIKKNKNFLKLNLNNTIKIIKQHKKLKNPQISIISPIYNRERYIIRFLKSIQNQNFQNIEIILIDDSSIDNSIGIIEEKQKLDKRIKLIKNKLKKGTFISRNLGSIYSNAKYLILPDPDDIITKNILNICYRYAEKYNYEIIRFNMYTELGKITMNEVIKNIDIGPVYQPYLSSFLFYGNNELEKIDYHICNKLIKKEVYIKGLNSINKNYLNMYIIYRDDSIINYALYRKANSFFFIKKIGYYYTINNLGVTNNLFSKSELRIKFGFILSKLVFEYSKNNKYEKDMFNFIFTIFNKNFSISQKLLNSNNNLNFYYNIIKLFLNSNFITNENKYILKCFKSIIEKKIKANKNI